MFDMGKYLASKAADLGLKIAGDEFILNQDAKIFVLSDQRGSAGISISGLEVIQNSGENLKHRNEQARAIGDSVRLREDDQGRAEQGAPWRQETGR